MYIRNDGKGESNITQNGFTAYLLSAVAHRKADYDSRCAAIVSGTMVLPILAGACVSP